MCVNPRAQCLPSHHLHLRAKKKAHAKSPKLAAEGRAGEASSTSPPAGSRCRSPVPKRKSELELSFFLGVRWFPKGSQLPLLSRPPTAGAKQPADVLPVP